MGSAARFGWFLYHRNSREIALNLFAITIGFNSHQYYYFNFSHRH